MESPTEAADSAAHMYSQVLFTEIPHTYPPSTSVTCCYNLTASFQPNSRDWVGVFKVGWSTTKDYHTFVWVEPCVDVEGQQFVTRQAVFKDYYLPKDENEFYQFCYVDSTGQVRGASTPFCFRNPADMSLEIIPEDDLLVITTQDQVDQSVREKAELQRELNQKMAENETLRNALKQEQQDTANWKEQKEENEKEKSRLVKELEQHKHLNNSLRQQQKENEELMVKMCDQLTEQKEQKLEEMELRKLRDSLSGDGGAREKEKHAQEKYDRAVAKINQLKAEREELKGKVDAQSSEVATLDSKVREQERELLKMTDSIQLLQVDLQSSEKEKERLSVELQRLQTIPYNMDDLKRENQELTRRLSQLEKLQGCPDDDLRVEIQALAGKLQDTQEKLAAEREESRTAKRRAGFLDGELQDAREQLKKVVCVCEEAQRATSKQELKLNEAHQLILDKDCTIEEKDDIIQLERQEKEELARENQYLIRDIEGLRRLNTELQASPVKPPHTQPEASAPPGTASATPEWEELETPVEEEHQYETIRSIANPDEEPTLVCRHCQESFPGITPEELEQHEQSHRVCPFCTVICDNMEQSVFEDHVYGHEL
ncbi:calcium-binding and coiled-coil domain-containing protein 2 [Tautogolabrus adspersus]